MKVIKKPPKEEWKIQEYCTGDGHSNFGCGALLEVEKEDLTRITYEHHGIYDDTIEIKYSFICPLCNEETNIKSLVPLKISHYLNKAGKCKKLRV